MAEKLPDYQAVIEALNSVKESIDSINTSSTNTDMTTVLSLLLSISSTIESRSVRNEQALPAQTPVVTVNKIEQTVTNPSEIQQPKPVQVDNIRIEIFALTEKVNQANAMLVQLLSISAQKESMALA